MSITRTFKVYGDNLRDGKQHRQRESFFPSKRWDFSTAGKTRILDVLNADKTGTNMYTIVRITRDTAEECLDELRGQITDGLFENSRTGDVVEILGEVESPVVLWT